MQNKLLLTKIGGMNMNANEQLDFLIDYLTDERNEVIDVPDDIKSKKD